MATTNGTAAGHARLLHQRVKVFRMEMETAGVKSEAAYMVLLNVVMRLAYEEHGEAGIANLLAVLQSGT